jgi:NAD(P)-dependent dehydrogenase (short-subunit alcohol dehydrogenase family)
MNVLDLFRLDGQVAVVTGGTRGLGRSMASAFASAGAATTIICSRNAADCEHEAAALMTETGGSVAGLACDVSDQAAVELMVAGIVEKYGRIDVWVNNAGTNTRHLVEDFPVPEFDRIIATNLKSTWNCCRALAPLLKQQGRGSVINVGSALSVVGLPERSAYCASKSAVIGLTRAVAMEWADSGARCNALCPGPFMTEINRPLLDNPEMAAAVVGRTAMRRWGSLHEIQGAALFLAADASSYVTGSSLFVDGGWTMH